MFASDLTSYLYVCVRINSYVQGKAERGVGGMITCGVTKLDFDSCRVIVTFGLNALRGKHRISHSVWDGQWDPRNAYDFIDYTISKGYKIDSWELGRAMGSVILYVHVCFI